MSWSDIAEIFSILSENPTTALIVVIIIIFICCKTENGFGTAFQDIPKHLTEAIIATYNFILSLLRREQIDYPPNHDPPQNSDNTKIDSEEKTFKDKIISLLKKVKG